MPENEQLSALRRMRDEGRISDEEYNHLARGLSLASSSEEIAVDDISEDDVAPPESEQQEPTISSRAFEIPSLRPGLSPSFLTGLGLLALLLVVTSAMGFVPWLATVALVLLMLSAIIDGWRKATMIGAIVAGAVALIGVAGALTSVPPTGQPVAATLPPQDPHPPVPGSLDIYMDQITDAWNTVDGPPRIVKGLTRHNETGEYDTFIYRWGAWGRLAGAYNPDNDVLYALLVSGQLSAEDTAQLYIPLCFMVAPYSQECVDSYFDHGLDGGTLDDYVDAEHETEWTYEDQTWRLEISENVMTIRVFGADAA